MSVKKYRVEVATDAAPGYQGFLGWLSKTHPDLYNTVRVSAPNAVQAIEAGNVTGSTLLAGLHGLAGDEVAAVSSVPSNPIANLITTVVQAGAQILPLVQQQKVLKMQLDRAAQGLPPLNVGQYLDPNAGVNIGVTPATQKLLMYGGLGLVGFLLVNKLLSRR